MTVQTVEFPSEGTYLRGRLYLADTTGRSPCVVMAHGTSATISMVIDDYAEAFYTAGISVLLYDHINFGSSGGDDRQVINPWLQGRGYRDAVHYLKSLPFIDSGRIALWGDSYAAMEVLVVGALIDGLAGIVSQIPACGIAMPPETASSNRLTILKNLFATADLNALEKDDTGFMPVVSFDQASASSFLKPIQAYKWFIGFGGRFGSGWENRVSRITPKTDVPFSPFETASALTAPVLFMTGKDDEMVHCNPDVQQAVYEMIPTEKEHIELDGGHFGLLYPGSPIFERSVQTQTRFLKGVLGLN